MARELKVRINDHQALAALLERKGAVPTDRLNFVDTYFRQPAGQVLKVAQKNDDYWLTALRAVNGQFELVSNETLVDGRAKITELAERYGVKSILQGQRLIYKLGDDSLTLNLIDNVGEFLIVTGADPQKSFIETELGLKSPEYISVPFDELPKLNP